MKTKQILSFILLFSMILSIIPAKAVEVAQLTSVDVINIPGRLSPLPLEFEKYLPGENQISNHMEAKKGKHPRILLDDEGWENVRAKINTPIGADIFSRLTEEVDILIEEPLYVYDPSDPDPDNSQRFIGDHIAYVSFTYKLTGDKKYFDDAYNWAMMACELPAWGKNNGDLAAGHILSGVGYFYDWCYNELSVSDRKTIVDALVQHGTPMYLAATTKARTWTKAYKQNHNWINNGGLAVAAAAIYEEYEDAPVWLEHTAENYAYVMDTLGTDGFSHEGVGYWGYGLVSILLYLDLARSVYGLDLYDHEWLKNTAYYRIYMSYSQSGWGYRNNFGYADSWQFDYNGPESIMRKLASEYNIPQAQWFAREAVEKGINKEEDAWLALMWYNPEIEEENINTLPTFKYFDDHGAISARSDWSGDESALYMRCGPYLGFEGGGKALSLQKHRLGEGHVHPDNNHFILYANGEVLIKDDGYNKKYTNTHNTLLVNGKGQKGDDDTYFNSMEDIEINTAKPEFKKVITTDEYDYFVGDATQSYPLDSGLEKFYRHMVYLKKNDTLLVIDDIKTDEIRPLELRLFPQSEKINKLSENEFIITSSRNNFYIKQLTPGGVVTAAEKVTVVKDINGNTTNCTAITMKTNKKEWINATALSWAPAGELRKTISCLQEGNSFVFDVDGKKITVDTNTMTVHNGIWVYNAENSFEKDITDIASVSTLTEANIETMMGEGWSIYNPNNTDISTTFGISQSTSATYNKDHMLEINRKTDSGQYHVIGLKKEFNEELNGRVKLKFETVADNNTNIYIYDVAGKLITRLRYHSNALKLTTAKSAETTICSVAYGNAILNWELDFDLKEGTMGLLVETSQNYSANPNNVVANLDVTSDVRRIKTTSPFAVADGGTNIKSFVIGTNVYGSRARILSLGIDAQKIYENEDTEDIKANSPCAVDFSKFNADEQLTADNVRTKLGRGWLIFNQVYDELGSTFKITEQPSEYNGAKALEIARPEGVTEYKYLGIKNKLLVTEKENAKITVRTATDPNTYVIVYDETGNVLIRLRYQGNAFRLTTSDESEKIIFKTSPGNVILTWELDFDLKNGKMNLSVSYPSESKPTNLVSNLTSSKADGITTVKTITPFVVSSEATSIKSFFTGTNRAGVKIRIFGVDAEFSSYENSEDFATTLVSITDENGNAIENMTGSISAQSKFINVNFSDELDERTISELIISKNGEKIETTNTISTDCKGIKVEFNTLGEGNYVISFEKLRDSEGKAIGGWNAYLFNVLKPEPPEIVAVSTYDGYSVSGELTTKIEEIQVQFNVPMLIESFIKENIVLLADGKEIEYTPSVRANNTKYILTFDSALSPGKYQLVFKNLKAESGAVLEDDIKEFVVADKDKWIFDIENSFKKDITEIASAGTLTPANVETVMGEGWSIYNPNNTDISATFGISQSTSSTYNKDHMLEVYRRADSSQYHVIGIKKDFNEALNEKVKLNFETVADNSTNIYIYNNEGNVIARLRYHSNALKLTTAKSAETTICSVSYATSLLNWELDFDLEAGTMDLTVTTSQAYAAAPSGAAANLDTTSTVRTVKTKTPFEITDGATNLKSFVVGTNVYGTRARILSLGAEVQKKNEVAVFESDEFEKSIPAGWSTCLADNAEGKVSISSEKAVVSGNVLKIENTGASNTAVSAEKIFAKPYTDDVLIETSFKGNQYTAMELFASDNSSIFRFYFDASKAQLRWQNSSAQLVALENHAYSPNRLYNVAFTVYPVEGTMDLTFSYTVSDSEKENVITTHDAFSSALDGNTVIISSKRPIKIGGPSGKNLSIEKIQLGIRRPGTTYFDSFSVKNVRKDALAVRTGILKDADGKGLNELTANEAETDYTYTLSLASTEAMKDVNVFVAHYSADGTFKKVVVNKTESVQATLSGSVEVSVPFTIKTSVGDKVRVFAMNSDLVPVFEGYDYLIK